VKYFLDGWSVDDTRGGRLCIVHSLLSSSAFLFQTSFVPCFNVIFPAMWRCLWRFAIDERYTQCAVGDQHRTPGGGCGCGSIPLDCGVVLSTCGYSCCGLRVLTSLWLYIVAGWVMPDFFSGCLEGQHESPYYFGLSCWQFVTGI
jgi:hypothetical protein